ncbi:dnaJ homolog subfamily B member 5-like [Drosophila subpulchrella]|uniref:dnaJ homolog subfamily B member 5-like n=1 Tax=Drosophila subpulchrella TaxID=1486046 RepID=UPI0018A141ED|nr:dnaJ homolog subfamily B member 5-like [Drosophila subpulchrella]
MEEDHYMILGVAQDATEEEITKAYKRMALIYHPDKNHHPRTVEYFKKIRAAFDVLSERKLRADYDRSLKRKSSNIVSNPRPAGTHPNYENRQTNQLETPDLLPTICAVGGVLVGLFMGFSAFKMFNTANNN